MFWACREVCLAMIPAVRRANSGGDPVRPVRRACDAPALPVELDELLQRLLHVSLDGAGRGRTHRAEQRTPAQLKAQAEGGPVLGWAAR